MKPLNLQWAIKASELVVFDVTVSPENVSSSFVNATFIPVRDYSQGLCDNTSLPSYSIRSGPFRGEKQPNATFTMKMNVTLRDRGVPLVDRQCNLTANFTKDGEYYLSISPIIYNVPSGDYSFSIFYQSWFNNTATIETSSWNSTLEIF